MSFLHCKIFFLLLSGVVPQTDRNQAVPRGSLCWGQLLQVQTCWKQNVLKGSFTKLSRTEGSGTDARDAPRTPVSLRMGVNLLEKLGPRLGLCKALCHSGDAELLLLLLEDHKHSRNRCFQKHPDNLSCWE